MPRLRSGRGCSGSGGTRTDTRASPRRARRSGRLSGVNFIEDVMERAPASQLGVVALAADGNRREWHFGELIARSAGLSGAFAARGVRRGDVVMTHVGSRI